jgi:hypothetical protein
MSVMSVMSVNSTGNAVRRLIAVLGCELALIVALHWSADSSTTIPFGSFADWVQATDPGLALVAMARLVALAIGYWLLVTTVLYALAHHLGWESMTDTLRWITLPAVRRIVQGVTAMSLTGASIMGPAAVSVVPALAQDDTIVAQADDTSSDETSAHGAATDGAAYEPDAAGWPQPDSGSDFWRPSSATQIQGAGQAGGQAAQPGNHTVVKGEHLWSISADHLRATVGREVTEDEIGQYWVRVIDANRSVIRSGDPDLIFPDEQITLPQVFSD